MGNDAAVIALEVNASVAPTSAAARKEAWSGRLGQFKANSPRDVVSESILALIRSGELKPGARLPSEPQLIELTGVSRSSVREAIRSLETMGLLEIRRGKGTYVRAIETSTMADAQMLLMLADRRVLENLVEVRVLLEPLMAQLAAERATAADLEALRRHLDGMRDAHNRDAWRSSHLAFHQALAEATHNIIMSKIWGMVAIFLKDSPLVTGGTEPTMPSIHETIYEAIAAHDRSAAEAAMAQQIRDMTRVL
jgi:GntR family transcriptional repressor for pyruvate dehydrogenase complex